MKPALVVFALGTLLPSCAPSWNALRPPSSFTVASVLEPWSDSLLTSQREGTGVVLGTLPGRLDGCPVRLRRGSRVALLPANAHTEELLRAWSMKTLVIVDPRVERTVRTTALRGDGYRFDGVPAGDWFVYTWADIVRPRPAIAFDMVILFDRVRVRGDSVRVARFRMLGR